MCLPYSFVFFAASTDSHQSLTTEPEILPPTNFEASTDSHRCLTAEQAILPPTNFEASGHQQAGTARKEDGKWTRKWVTESPYEAYLPEEDAIIGSNALTTYTISRQVSEEHKDRPKSTSAFSKKVVWQVIFGILYLTELQSHPIVAHQLGGIS